jgi:hypothetical protein
MPKVNILDEELNQPSDNIMELVVVENELGKLAINYDQLKKQLDRSLKIYDSFEVTEDNIPISKTERANLNNLVKVIDNKRKELKKEFLKPYELVETQCNELKGMIDGVVSKIDTGIKSFENKVKEEKYNEIKKYYDSFDWDIVPFGELFEDRYLNSGVKTSEWQKSISDKIMGVNQELSLINNFDVEDKELLKAYYLDTLNLALAKEKYDRNMAARARFVESKVETQKVEDIVKVEEPIIPKVDELLYELKFKVTVTETQLNKLNTFLDYNNIAFEQLED